MSFNLLVFPFMDHNISVNLRTLCLDPKDLPPLKKKKRFIVLYFKVHEPFLVNFCMRYEV